MSLLTHQQAYSDAVALSIEQSLEESVYTELGCKVHKYRVYRTRL